MAYETFPLNPQFSYTMQPNFRTLQTPFDSGHIQTRAMWTQPRRHFMLAWVAAFPSEAETAQSFYREHCGPADPFYFTSPDPISRPFAAPALGYTSGGSLGDRTRYASFAWGNSSDQSTTVCVNTGILALLNGQRLTVTIPEFPAGVDRAYVYVGVTTSLLKKQPTTITVSEGMWTEPSTGYDSGGAAPPAANACEETVLVHFLEDALDIVKISAEYYQMRMTLQELFTQ